MFRQRLQRLAVLLGALALTGCITPLPDLTQSRSPCRSEPGGWCNFVRDGAVKSYAYAMLSSNSYKDEDTYTKLPLAFVERKAADNDDSGLAYSVFDRYAVRRGKRGKLLARVIAFRGTEFGSTSDIFSGSLGDSQRNGARAVYAAERAQLDAELLQLVPIEVTGHSLGGALATQISIENPDVEAYIFNSSPFFSGDPMMNDTNRIAVSERGEFLRVLRKYKTIPAADQLVINCNPSATAGQKHSIRKLADCLTWIAAYEDTVALDLLEPNAILKPEVECGEADKVHPGVSKAGAGKPIETCVHQAAAKKPEA
jgi:pimeloyl-ACP methyl ester carboxylesterase